MTQDYKISSIVDYFDILDGIKYLSINEYDIRMRMQNYFLNLKRYTTNEKILEALLV